MSAAGIARLQQITATIQELTTISNSPSMKTSSFSNAFGQIEYSIGRLVDEFPDEYESYNLDEAVVAAITPLVSLLSSQLSG